MTVELKITMSIGAGGPVRDITVDGPTHDTLLCYMMLEGAKDVVRDNNAVRQSPIVAAPAAALELAGR